MDISSLTNSNGYIKIAALDHRGSLKKMIAEDKLADFKSLCTKSFAPYSTAALVDPEYGADAIVWAREMGVGVLLSREVTGYEDSPSGRETQLYPNFTAHKLKDMGATAIKLLLYYNHAAPNANKQLEIARKAFDEAHDSDLPLLIEPITYAVDGSPYHKGDAIVRAIKDLTPFADVLKLEYPIDIDVSAMDSAIPYLSEISRECTGPWVLLSRGMPFDLFKKAVQISKENGAMGYAVGRAVWQEVAEMNNWEDQKTFIETTAKDRMHELSEIFE